MFIKTIKVGKKFKYKKRAKIDKSINISEKNIIKESMKALKFEITSLKFLVKKLDPFVENSKKGNDNLLLK